MSEIKALGVISERQVSSFWSKIDRSGSCWIWRGGRNRDGYGKFQVTNVPRPKSKADGPLQYHVIAHRMAFALAHRRCAVGLLMHSCDTPACCNPDHLTEGTHLENHRDSSGKGRRCGTHAGHPRVLSAEKAAAIREAVANGATLASQAREFGCSRSTIVSVVRGRTWA